VGVPTPHSWTQIVVCNNTGVVIRLAEYVNMAGDLVEDVTLSRSTFIPGDISTEVAVLLSTSAGAFWDGTDAVGGLVPPGPYRIYVCSNDGLGGDAVFVRNVMAVLP